MGKSKFYAVRKGHSMGIFTDWATCQQAVNGFPGAQFKSFHTRAEAEAFLAGGGRAGPSPHQQQQQQAHAAPALGMGAPAGQRGGGSGKFFAIVKGRQTGVFPGTWDDVKGLIQGFSGASFKAFSTQAEAEQHFASMSGMPPPAAAAGPSASLTGSKRSYGDIDSRPPPPAFTAGTPAAAAAAGAAAAGTAAVGAGASGLGELQVTVFFDGGSRGNPGRAGYGYALFDRSTNDRVWIGCRPLPYKSTNNEAEYSGMIAGLRRAIDCGARHVVVKGDSQLAVKQMKGEYRVTAPTILPLYREAKLLAEQFSSFQIQHVYRDENTIADRLSNIAMDTDTVVDKIAAGTAGHTRRQMAAALLQACDLGGRPDVLEPLCTDENFFAAVSRLLVRVWDSMDPLELEHNLNSRGWDPHTGGPPEPSAAAAAGGAGAAAGGGGGGVSEGGGGAMGAVGRGQHTIAAAAVAVAPPGPKWAVEVGRQEQLMGAQQQQQRGQQGFDRMGFGEQFLRQQPARQQHVLSAGRGGGGSSGRVAPQSSSSNHRGWHDAQQARPAGSSIRSAGSRIRSGLPQAGLLVDSSCAQRRQQQQQQLGGLVQPCVYGWDSSQIPDLQRRRPLPAGRPCSSSSSSSVQGRVLSFGQPLLVRCSCSTASRELCALHAVLARAGGGGACMRAASAAAVAIAAAAAASRRYGGQRGQHAGRGRGHSLKLL